MIMSDSPSAACETAIEIGRQIRERDTAQTLDQQRLCLLEIIVQSGVDRLLDQALRVLDTIAHRKQSWRAHGIDRSICAIHPLKSSVDSKDSPDFIEVGGPSLATLRTVPPAQSWSGAAGHAMILNGRCGNPA
jgi:hypothetical protein